MTKRNLEIKRETKKGVKIITLPQIKMGETMFCGQNAKKAVIIKPRKLTKAQEKEALQGIGKIITSISKSVKKTEREFIDGMVKLMKEQAVLMKKCREDGLNPTLLMEKVKEEYLKTK